MHLTFSDPAVRVVELRARPLAVALRDPFVIASARMEATRAMTVVCVIEDARGVRATGLGEAATLPPVTDEDEHAVAANIDRVRPALVGARFDTLFGDDAPTPLDVLLGAAPVTRAAIESALLDAFARLRSVPLGDLFAGRAALPFTCETDVTLPITESPPAMRVLAERWWARGFRVFKVKVGRDIAHDLACLAAVHDVLPTASYVLDANGGYTASEALHLLEVLLDGGLRIACLEQPCARADLAGMIAVTARSSVPVIADESLRTPEDLAQIIESRAAHGVNLKLVKHGGPLAALALGRAALEAGLSVMAGAMVETRLGLSTMGHVVAALSVDDPHAVSFIDLDTAFLLAGDPFVGGYRNEGDGPRLTFERGVGHGVTLVG